MITNAVLTIFNQFPDREVKKMVFVPHKLDPVWFYVNQKSSVGTNGLSSADEYKIRVPYSICTEWMPPEEFRELSEPGDHWTVQNGDLFIVGEWVGGRISGIAELKKDFFGVVGTVLSHSENFYGASKHIRIVGGS